MEKGEPLDGYFSETVPEPEIGYAVLGFEDFLLNGMTETPDGDLYFNIGVGPSREYLVEMLSDVLDFTTFLIDNKSDTSAWLKKNFYDEEGNIYVDKFKDFVIYQRQFLDSRSGSMIYYKSFPNSDILTTYSSIIILDSHRSLSLDDYQNNRRAEELLRERLKKVLEEGKKENSVEIYKEEPYDIIESVNKTLKVILDRCTRELDKLKKHKSRSSARIKVNPKDYKYLLFFAMKFADYHLMDTMEKGKKR